MHVIVDYTVAEGSGKIWLDDVGCIGTENRLDNCSHIGWGENNCRHHEDVGVRCIKMTSVRLADGISTYDGRLEIYYNDTWGTVCDNSFTYRAAIVACNQLEKRADLVEFYRIGGGTGMIWLNNLDCTGGESALEICRHNDWGINDCTHDQDVGIRCYANHIGNEGQLRLVDGSFPEEGRLEIYHDGTWGTICDGMFNLNAAMVACRQLNYRFTDASFYTAGGGFGTIWLNNVVCDQFTEELQNCSHSGWGIENCGHQKDVGVRCRGEYAADRLWSCWSEWSSCSSGIQARNRSCNTPLTLHASLICTEESTQQTFCSGTSYTNSSDLTVDEN